jgi:uncharacterized membrane protein YccC
VSRLALFAPLVVVLAVGCNGGTVDRHALQQDSSTIDSLACEGALLAHDVSEGATTKSFARVHADNLRAQASHLEDALAERPTASGIRSKVREASRDAGEVAQLLSQLHHHPTDRALADRIESELERAGECK